MTNSIIKTMGKSIFYILWGIGTVCLIGYPLTNNIYFAIAGFYLLIIGTIISTIIIIGLFIYGLVESKRYDACLVAITYLIYNVPIAAIYALIGLEIIGL